MEVRMPVPVPWDHAVLALLFLVLPFLVAWKYRQFVVRVRSGAPGARAGEYRSTIRWQWGVTLALLAAWWLAGRPLPVLGFAVPGGWRLVVGAGATLLGLGLLFAQWRAVLALDAAGAEKLRAQMEPVVDVLPHTHREHRLFRLLAITAGVCEEIVFRGYVLWHLDTFVPMWAAVVIGATAFGLGHLYQGAAGVVKTGVVGLVAGALYAGTGSLLWPIVLHVAIDLQGGAIGWRMLGGSEARSAAPST
jgi:membrane protease YdiL (CAAX protease family)